MNLSERWNHILVALSVREDETAKNLKQKLELARHLMQQVQAQADEVSRLHKALERADHRNQLLIARCADLFYRQSAKGLANVLNIFQHNDSIGDITVAMEAPDGRTIIHSLKPGQGMVPEQGFNFVSIGAISSNVPFENPSSPGTLIANAMRRFNDNVMRFDNFKGIVRDEGVIQDGNDLGTSTVLLEFGKRAYEIVVTSREVGSITVPDGAIADPALPKGREEIHPLDLRAKAMGKKPN